MASNNHQKVIDLVGNGDCPGGRLFAGVVFMVWLPFGILLIGDCLQLTGNKRANTMVWKQGVAEWWVGVMTQIPRRTVIITQSRRCAVMPGESQAVVMVLNGIYRLARV